MISQGIAHLIMIHPVGVMTAVYVPSLTYYNSSYKAQVSSMSCNAVSLTFRAGEQKGTQTLRRNINHQPEAAFSKSKL